jgi:cell wall-associated NlpC family hydrolase
MNVYKLRYCIGLFALLGLLGLQSCSSTKSIRPANRTKVSTKRAAVTAKPSNRVRTPKQSQDEITRSEIINSAHRYIGTKYVYGGRDAHGFDCSGLVRKVFFENKIDIRGNSSSLSKQGTGKSIISAKAGDLVFFKKGDNVNHVALVTEINKNELWVIHSTSSKGVIKENILASNYWSRKKYFIKDLL